MTRIEGVNPGHLSDEYIAKVLDAQAKMWGAPLLNRLIYARRPSIFRGARGMWTGIESSGLINSKLRALLNRRVAALNGCEFSQDINAAVGSKLGLSDEKILALADYAASPLYSEAERVAIERCGCNPRGYGSATDVLWRLGRAARHGPSWLEKVSCHRIRA